MCVALPDGNIDGSFHHMIYGGMNCVVGALALEPSVKLVNLKNANGFFLLRLDLRTLT